MPENKLRRAIKQYGSELTAIFRERNIDLDGATLLAALCYAESKFNPNIKPTVDPALLPGGEQYKKFYKYHGLRAVYGDAAACQFGPMQVAFHQALQLDQSCIPEDLCDTDINIRLATQLLIDVCMADYQDTISEIISVYKQMNHSYKRRPSGFIKKVINAYNGVAKNWLYEL